MVQWLRLWACKAGGTGSIPGRGTKLPHAAQRSQKKRRRYQDSDNNRGETMSGQRRKAAIYKSRKEASEETDPADLDLRQL